MYLYPNSYHGKLLLKTPLLFMKRFHYSKRKFMVCRWLLAKIVAFIQGDPFPH